MNWGFFFIAFAITAIFLFVISDSPEDDTFAVIFWSLILAIGIGLVA